MITIRYEAGTLLVSQNLQALPKFEQEIPDLKWDKRVGDFRLPAYRYFALIRFLQDHKAEYEDLARQYETVPLTFKVTQEPRPFQKLALAEWRKAYFRGYISLPTGSGKSYVALLAMEMTKRSCLILAPTIDLMNQWYHLVSTYFGIEVGLIGGGYYDVKPITITTYDSAYIHMEHLGHKFGLIIFDECHHLPGASYTLAAQMCLAPFRLGLSATPEREDGRHSLLDDLIGRKVYEEQIGNLAGAYLAEYETIRLEVDLLDAEREEYERERQTYRDFLKKQNISFREQNAWQQFIFKASRSLEGREALRAYFRQKFIAVNPVGKIRLLAQLLRQHPGERILIFTSNNETVYAISQALLVPVITHQTKAKERKDILEKFSAGTYPILATSKVLNEGIDVPEASIGIILSGSGSVREHVQRLGRILRAKPGKNAILYEVVSRNTAEEYTSLKRREHEAYQTR
jgi:superfamily II DNA or RNA helicase